MRNLSRTGITLLLVALLMAAGLASAQAAFDGDFEYRVENGAAIVTGYRGSDSDVVVPDTLGALPVTRIDNNAFRNSRTLVSIVIPEGVTTIGGFAFQNCRMLTDITLPESLTAFGASVFKDCVGLREIVLPSRITVISERMFYDCVGLNSVYIPDSVTVIEAEAFYGNRGLTSLTLPGSVQDIAKNMFNNTNNLTLTVEKDSYAERVAKNRSIPFVYIVEATEAQ
jgi:hypothetical protein